MRFLKVGRANTKIEENISDFKEAKLLYLNIEKARTTLNWRPHWDFQKTIHKSVSGIEKFLIMKLVHTKPA